MAAPNRRPAPLRRNQARRRPPAGKAAAVNPPVIVLIVIGGILLLAGIPLVLWLTLFRGTSNTPAAGGESAVLEMTELGDGADPHDSVENAVSQAETAAPVIPAGGGLTVDNLTMLDMDSSHVAAVTKDGSLYVWGDYTVLNGEFTEVHVPVKIMDDVKAVCAGYRNYLILKTDGSLYFLGGNTDGRVCAEPGDAMQSPVKIMDDVASVTDINDTCYAITTDGSLYSWGISAGYLLGRSAQHDDPVPAKILDNVKSVDAAGDVAGAITEDGSLYVWGYYIGQLIGKEGQDNRERMKVMDHVAEFAVGDSLEILTEDGSLYMLEVEELHRAYKAGMGVSLADLFQPEKVMDNVKTIDCWGSRCAAVTNDGSLYLWGPGSSFERVDSFRLKDLLEPTKVMDQVASVKLSSSFSVAYMTDGRVLIWGSNDRGQFGNGTTEGSDTPIELRFAS